MKQEFRFLLGTVLIGSTLLGAGTALCAAESTTKETVSKSAISEEQLTFKGETDRNPLLYKCGEPMKFTVVLEDRQNAGKPLPGWKLRWTRNGDDGKTETGEAMSDTPLVVTTSIDKPGFIRLRVEVLNAQGQPVKHRNAHFDGSAGAEVNKIQAYPLPADFNEFWDGEVKKIKESKCEAKLTPVKWSNPRISVFKFEIPTFPGERNATGLIGYLNDAKPGTQGLVVDSIGYGFGRYWVQDPIILQGNVFITLARQGEDPINDEAYYRNLEQNEMKSFCFRNNNDLRQNDFYKMIMRNLRALQYAKTRPEWNGKTIHLTGGSMGGFQTIALAALDSDVTSLYAKIPWVADLAGAPKFQRMEGWRPGFTETLGYFDTANLATRVKCPAEIVIGLGDYVCPPSGEMILFRNLKGKKTLKAYQNFGHGFHYGIPTEAFVFEQEIK